MKNLVLILILFVTSNAVFAQNADGLIEKVSVQNGMVYIKVENIPSTRPSCAANNNWDYAFELESATGKALYSLILSAYTAKLSVVIIPESICTLQPGMEDTKRIILQ